MKKYELTDQTIEHIGRTLHRIQALRSFADVKAEDLGRIYPYLPLVDGSDYL
jgi:hypothetical protein